MHPADNLQGDKRMTYFSKAKELAEKSTLTDEDEIYIQSMDTGEYREYARLNSMHYGIGGFFSKLDALDAERRSK